MFSVEFLEQNIDWLKEELDKYPGAHGGTGHHTSSVLIEVEQSTMCCLTVLVKWRSSQCTLAFATSFDRLKNGTIGSASSPSFFNVHHLA